MVRRDASYTIHGSGSRAVHIILSLPAGGTPVRAVEGNRSRVCPRPQPGPRRRTLVAPLGARRRRLFGDDRRARDLFLGLRGLAQGQHRAGRLAVVAATVAGLVRAARVGVVGTQTRTPQTRDPRRRISAGARLAAAHAAAAAVSRTRGAVADRQRDPLPGSG